MLLPLAGSVSPLSSSGRRLFTPSSLGFYHYYALREPGSSAKLHSSNNGTGTISNGVAVNYVEPWFPGCRAMAGYSGEAGGGPVYNATSGVLTFPNLYKLRTVSANAYDIYGADRTLCIHAASMANTNGILGSIAGAEYNRGQVFQNSLSGTAVYNSNGAFVSISPNWGYPVFVTQLAGGTTRVYSGATVSLTSSVTTAGTDIGGQYITNGNHEAGFGTANMTLAAFGVVLKSGGLTINEMQALSDYWRSL